MFRSLVESVALFGEEIWCWYNDRRLEKIQRKYVKWLLGLEKSTPNYIINEEGKIKEMWLKALSRGMTYEERTRKSDKKLIVDCLEAIDKEKRSGEESKWEKAKRQMLVGEGYNKEYMKTRRGAREQSIAKEVAVKIEKREEKERREKIKESRYNRYYEGIITEELPEYLKRKMKAKDRKMIARFRCGNICKDREHWKEEKERLCRLCGEENEGTRTYIKKM
ncbi:hypothetical protein WH47_05392 [Habropoda laboriosa]|uniref:Uncharacterized protein n=1 Tax=Habropoda laboriosa TaxID=597456 RepID=A0A0L7QJI0_9HYME|nr:hypothetical protein WH47_05392 [Habropoda laboriosa]